MNTKQATSILAGSRDHVAGVLESTILEALNAMWRLRQADPTDWPNNHKLLIEAYDILGAPYFINPDWELTQGCAWESGCHPIQR